MRAALSAGRYSSIRLRPKPGTSSAAFADIPSHVPGASRVHVGGARSARREILGHRLSRIRESLADRRHVGAEDGLALGTAPQVGARHGVEGALEARHHVAREELVALQSVLAARPLVGAEEDSAEAALREVDEALDALDHGLGALSRVYLAQGQLVVIGHVAVDDQAPLAAIHGGPVLGRRLLADAPVL